MVRYFSNHYVPKDPGFDFCPERYEDHHHSQLLSICFGIHACVFLQAFVAYGAWLDGVLSLMFTSGKL